MGTIEQIEQEIKELGDKIDSFELDYIDSVSDELLEENEDYQVLVEKKEGLEIVLEELENNLN